MAEKAPAFKFTTNVAVPVTIRFVDVRPGKLWLDPKTKQNKQLPPQVSIKGTFGDTDTIAYLPGPVWKNVKALVEGGVIADTVDTDALELVTEPTAIPVLDGNVTATLSKLAGERYEHMVYTRAGQPTPVPSRRVPPPSGAPPQGANRKLPFDEEPPYTPEAQRLAPNPHNAALHVGMSGPPDAPLHGEEPEPQPYRETALGEADNADGVKRRALEDAYLGLYGRVLFDMATTHHAQANIAPPLTSETVQAATASVFIAWDKLGLLRSIASSALQRHAEGE